MNKARLLNVFVLILALASCGLSASELVHKESRHKNTKKIEAQKKASQWSITERDWFRYKEIMSGPRGIWTPNADPLLVLGAHASSTEERDRFADIFVRLENQRVKGELEFQKAIDQAWKRNYPNQKRVNLLPSSASNTKKSKHSSLLNSLVLRYALVVEDKCIGCDEVLQKYIGIIQDNPGSKSLDIFVRKTQNSDKKLRDWVTANMIPTNLIKDNRVTINHGQKYENGQVPAVWVLREDGTWQQIK